MRSSRPRTVRWLAAGAAGALGALLVAGPAAAHVTVDPSAAPAGGYVEVSFRVPSESDTASTTKVQVFFPTDHPIASVSLKPIPGWTGTAQTSKLAKPIKSDDGDVTSAVSTVTWQGSLAPGQFQDFDVSMGPLPTDTTSLTFKALQTYSDGSVVRWIDVAAPGAPEPDHPAPVLHLTSASAGTAGTSDTAGATASATPAAAPASSGGTDTTARVLGGVGLAVGAIGLVAAFVAVRRRPEPAAAGTPAPGPASTPEPPEE